MKKKSNANKRGFSTIQHTFWRTDFWNRRRFWTAVYSIGFVSKYVLNVNCPFELVVKNLLCGGHRLKMHCTLQLSFKIPEIVCYLREGCCFFRGKINISNSKWFISGIPNNNNNKKYAQKPFATVNYSFFYANGFYIEIMTSEIFKFIAHVMIIRLKKHAADP